MNILYIEDNLSLAETIKLKLSPRYNVDVAGTGQQGIQKLENKDFDMVVIDYFLPDTNGLDVCKAIRKINIKIPILIFTTNENHKNIVEALDSGADDYLTKPFHFQELEARIRALIRRSNALYKDKTIVCGELKLDLSKNIILYKNYHVILSRQEFILLKYLMINKNRIISRQEIFEHVWNKDEYYNSNTIDVHIRRIRNKLKEYSNTILIKSIYGMGYMFKLD